MAELAQFCLAPKGASYAWWRAGPWAGKSALLSTFVLHPPPEVAEQVKIVSFFITGRLAAQDTREAFTQVLLEQLAGLLGQSLPAVLPESTRDAFLLGLMSEAADACREAGGRLVLVVDGLDEDRGITAGPGAYSIAGLLPGNPPAGMRVIVAGRPNPPVPDDVPGGHPLRDPGIIRVLTASAHAQGVQRLGRLELKRLLHGGPGERDVLGLVTAARGGLSARDLAELAGIPLWEVEGIVHAAAGRTFGMRTSGFDLDARPEVYLLGHEELQAAASDYLADSLAGYRDRLHGWADGYRARMWPAETPDYLLAGYFRLLEDAGDLPRMTALAGDTARHDRMLSLTGGDAATLREARTALDRIAAQDMPDLADALALAVHRDLLGERNARIPAGLPAVWVILGRLARADALAASIDDPFLQGNAQAEIAGALAEDGHYEQAEAAARSITAYLYCQESALAKVAAALAGAGQHERAEVLVRSIADPGMQAVARAGIAAALAGAGQLDQAEAIARAAAAADSGMPPRALAAVAEALAGAGDLERAEAFARCSASPQWQASALAGIAVALAGAGQRDRAAISAVEAAASLASAADPYLPGPVLIEVAGALARSGLHEQAEAMAEQANNAYREDGVVSFLPAPRAVVAQALAQGGQYQEAEATARSVTDPDSRAIALAEVARALARAGRHRQAEAIALEAESVARAAGADPSCRAADLARVAEALALTGQEAHARDLASRAVSIARSVTDPLRRRRALTEIAGPLARAGQRELAAAIALEAEASARSTLQEHALAQVTSALTWAGRQDRAEAITRSLTDPYCASIALAEAAVALASGGHSELASSAAIQAETTARSVTDPNSKEQALHRAAKGLAWAGKRERAEAIAAHCEAAALSADPFTQSINLLSASETLAWTGQHERAESVARSISMLDVRAAALAQVAGGLARAGHHERAEAIARAVAEPDKQAAALAEVAEALALAGESRAASRVAAAACAAGPWPTAARPVLMLAPSAFSALAPVLNT